MAARRVANGLKPLWLDLQGKTFHLIDLEKLLQSAPITNVSRRKRPRATDGRAKCSNRSSPLVDLHPESKGSWPPGLLSLRFGSVDFENGP